MYVQSRDGSALSLAMYVGRKKVPVDNMICTYRGRKTVLSPAVSVGSKTDQMENMV